MSKKPAAGVDKKSQKGYSLRESQSSAKPATGKKDTVAAPSASDLDQLGELPRTYGTDTIFLIAQEPHWLFTYWDIDISRHPGGPTFLRVTLNDKDVESEIEVPFETRNWYIPAKVAGGLYGVEIGYHRNDTWNVIARSSQVTTPSDHVSDEDSFEYATIPLHLSFQKLMENIHTAINGGETLLQALSRLQKDGKLFGAGLLPHLSTDQRIVLEALLGKNILDELSSGSFTSQEIEDRIRGYLNEQISSGGGSEQFNRKSWGPQEASLFSALNALAGTPGASWSTAALSSWATGTLTSWAAAGQSSWSGVETSAGGISSSWIPTSLSSWVHTTQSSWGGLTSWNQAALSSWENASLTSWGGSENVGSFGQATRSFFMHLNAEVIFYGGTDPQAKVTIDGKPVTLNPDGTFRYHFIFPDGKYEVPIVAESPDGVETRKGVLRFERSTAKYGKVDDTAQPPLQPPMGASS